MTFVLAGAIKLPEDVNEVLGVQLETFVIPEVVVKEMETLLLRVAPLQINYIASGLKKTFVYFRIIFFFQKDKIKGRLFCWYCFK